MSNHEFLPGTDKLSPAGIESFRAEIKEVSRQFDLHFIEDAVEKVRFIEGDEIYPLPVMPRKRTIGQPCGTKDVVANGQLEGS